MLRCGSCLCSPFAICSKLESIDIPATVRTIGNEAFRSATALAKVGMVPGLTSIGTLF